MFGVLGLQSVQKRLAVFDDVSQGAVRFFHPQKQLWAEHFSWSVHGSLVIDKTTVGRVTIIALRMNLG